MEYLSIILFIILAVITAQNNLDVESVNKAIQEIQEEKKLEELRKILGPDYRINIHVGGSNRYSYYIEKLGFRKKSEVCHTLGELEGVVATIKSFIL